MPFLYEAVDGGLSTVEYPGPPLPCPVGSPPWITKSGTIRWNTVPSKNFLSARWAIDAEAFGDCFTSSLKANVPQLVFTLAVYVFFGSSLVDGFLSEPSGFGFGSATVVQPAGAFPACVPVVVAVVDDEVSPPLGMSLVLLPPPQPARTTSSSTGVSRSF